MQTQTTEWLHPNRSVRPWSSHQLAGLAVEALRTEALLTPKPGLVDRRSAGSHHDLSLHLMLASAESLHEGFVSIAAAAKDRSLSTALREELGALGREAEARMLRITGGVNTHRGAIWALGLLIAGCASAGDEISVPESVARASALACLPDRFSTTAASHGSQMRQRFAAGGATQEARDGFPHVILHGLPALLQARRAGATEDEAQFLCLLAVMATLEDTCLLYRGGMDVLRSCQSLAARAYRLGGPRTAAGQRCMIELEDQMRRAWASPGGSADLLAATLFLDAYDCGPMAEERQAPCRN